MAPTSGLQKLILRAFGFNSASLDEALHGARHTTGKQSIEERAQLAIKLTHEICQARKITKLDRFLTDPRLMIRKLVQFDADEPTILAGIIYPALRQLDEIAYDPKYLGMVRESFGDEVANIVLKTLQIREIRLLERVNSYLVTAPVDDGEGRRHATFRHMVREVAGDDMRTLDIRLAQRLIRMEAFADQLEKKEKAHTIDEMKKCREFVHEADYLYIPLAKLRNRTLADELENQRVRLADPTGYNAAKDIIDRIKRVALKELGAEFATSSPEAAGRRMLEEIEAQIQEQIGQSLRELKGPRIKIERGFKTPASLYKKIMAEKIKGKKPDLTDIIRFRVIVEARNPVMYEASIDSEQQAKKNRKAMQFERPLVPQIHAALTQKFQTEEGRFKDYDKDPTQGGTREDNGYRAIHDTFSFGFRGKFEVQIVGRAYHYNNTYGTAAHDRYKGLPDDMDQEIKSTVSVFGPGNEIYALPWDTFGSEPTIADLAIYIDPEWAITVASAHVVRNHLFEPVIMNPDNPLDVTLKPGDKINLELDRNLDPDLQKTRLLGAATGSYRDTMQRHYGSQGPDQPLLL